MARAQRGRSEPPYQNLTPDLILDAIETRGGRCDGRLLALNSYENRVYQVWLEDGHSVIAKFYRPRRWDDRAILEEHAYAAELAAREIPVVAPLAGADGETLHRHKEFRFALFPRRPGRAPELDRPDTLSWIGRFLGRIHAVGALAHFEARQDITVASFGREPAEYLLAHGFIPPDLVESYRSTVEESLRRIALCYTAAGATRAIRLHGDCHAGNILWTDEGPYFVDLDDCRNGPAVQDLWMLLSGERDEMNAQLAHVIAGYREFHDFSESELMLVEALRTLRMIHYAGWLARRWDDPAFPASFPWFNTQRYWQDHILALREQCAAMEEPPLELP